MNKILSVKQAIELSSRLRKQNKTIVLAGGVFDILHLGHVKFLRNAKKYGDTLFLLLESDESVRKNKGPERPINKQGDRAELLSALSSVDYIISLKGVLKDKDYDKIIKEIRPGVIATSGNDTKILHKRRQAKLINARLKIVLKRIKRKSTTKIINKRYG